MTPTAVVVDDATIIRESLPSRMPRLDFRGSFPSVEKFLMHRIPADLVVLDLHLVNARQPEVRQGIAALRAVCAAGYRVCIYSQEERRFVLAACLAAGAHGIVSKAESTATAEEAFLEVAEGGTVLPQQVIGLMEVLVRRNNLTVLGERQRQVLAGRARGLTYAEMAKQLYLSESTLRGYWRDLTMALSKYLAETTPGEIEQALGLAPNDLLAVWPESAEADTTDERRWWKVRR